MGKKRYLYLLNNTENSNTQISNGNTQNSYPGAR